MIWIEQHAVDDQRGGPEDYNGCLAVEAPNSSWRNDGIQLFDCAIQVTGTWASRAESAITCYIKY